MKALKIQEILQATGGTLLKGDLNAQVKSVSIDSRTANEGDMFLAIQGEFLDGHGFIGQAIEKGCTTIVISCADKEPEEDVNVILVENSRKALQDLAKYYLSTLKIEKKIAITGSVGKTSTRDMMYAIASTKYKTGKNQKNLNNQFGLPLTLLSFDDSIEVAVLEMGMENPGEIDNLVHIAPPDGAIITNIGMSHIERPGLGTRENILKAKMEITHCFNENSLLVVNHSCDLLTRENVSGNYRVVTVGFDGDSEYIVSDVQDFGENGISYTLEHQGSKYQVDLPVPGAHNALNATLAIATGVSVLAIPIEQAIDGLRQAELTGKRLNIGVKNGVKVIDDSYNASLESMKSGINTLVATQGKRKIAILGAILELGAENDKVHYQVGKYAGEKNLDLVIAIGDKARPIAEGALEHLKDNQVRYYDTKADFIKELWDVIAPEDVVLVKASHGIHMEEIVNKIFEDKEQ